MTINNLKRRSGIEEIKRLDNLYSDLEQLIIELNKRDLPQSVVEFVNLNIDEVNTFEGENKLLLRHLRKTVDNILKHLEKEVKLVTKNHYRRLWLVLGLSVFGISFGVALGASLGNMGLIGVGLPIGMAIGIAVGTAKDKEAFKKGNQLDVEIRQVRHCAPCDILCVFAVSFDE